MRPFVRRVGAVLDRSFARVVRTRALWLLAAGYAATVVGLTRAGGADSYLGTALDLLTPAELLVPVLAVAVGYRAVLADAAGGELSVLRTYPLPRSAYVLGTYLGRLAALVAALVVPLVPAAALVAAGGGPESTVVAAHATADSALLLVRFGVLTAVYGAVALAAVVALSALAGGPRPGLALGGGLVVVLWVGLDLGLVGLLAGGVVDGSSLSVLLAVSPASAYRGLVLSTVVGGGPATTVAAASPAANLAGLGGWLVVSLATARWAAWR